MTYPKQPKLLQFVTIGIHAICLVVGCLCANADNRWNSNSYRVNRLALLHTKYKLTKPFNFEEQIIIEKEITREYITQVAGLGIWGFMLALAMIHCYLCFLLNYYYYRKYVNMYFHLAGAGVILVGSICYVASFVQNDEKYNRHFEIIYEGVPSRRVPYHPCKFPQLESGLPQLFTGRPYACQDSWAKFFVILLSVINIFLHLIMVFVVAFFVEEEDAAEMLYKEMEIVGGGALPPVYLLPPLPYYARPMADSPTSKKRKHSKGINRVEVPSNWTDPKADLTKPPPPDEPLTPITSEAEDTAPEDGNDATPLVPKKT